RPLWAAPTRWGWGVRRATPKGLTPLGSAKDAAQNTAQDFTPQRGAHGAHGRFGHGLGQPVALSAPRAGAAKQHIVQPAHQATAVAVCSCPGRTRFAVLRGLGGGVLGAALEFFVG